MIRREKESSYGEDEQHADKEDGERDEIDKGAKTAASVLSLPVGVVFC